jgi:nucleoside-diphosphate-sugar epimerase
MRRALVTGAAGFIGANLVRRLLGDGHRVIAAVRPGSDLWRLEAEMPNLRLATVDLRERDAVRELVSGAEPSWIFHLATHGAYSSQRKVAEILETNVVGTANILDAALESGFDAFVNSGSSSEYGPKDHAPSESEPLEPNSTYAVGKAAAAMYCRHSARAHDAHVVTLRLYSAYGAWEEPGRLVPALVLAGLRGELPPLVDPAIARDFVQVEDVVDACLLAAGATSITRGSIYNVGTGRQTSLEQAVETLRDLLEIEAEADWGSMPNRSWDTTTWVGDPTLIGEELGWRPRHDFRGGLAATIEWFRSVPELRTRYEGS